MGPRGGTRQWAACAQHQNTLLLRLLMGFVVAVIGFIDELWFVGEEHEYDDVVAVIGFIYYLWFIGYLVYWFMWFIGL